ncbi:MAG: hypothetical protein JSR48_09045 [Verrucomicrobia bacterium]|nr:hypothetical protein [Verrucomicrobiota bacterium]
MKRIVSLLIALALPMLAGAQDKAATPAAAPAKSRVISSYYVSVKAGQDAAFRAALVAHAKKYHKGDFTWRVGDVRSGPHGNMYQIVEGPFTWTALDGRGDLGAEHTKDYETNVMPLVESTTPDMYATYEDDLSTVATTQWSNKVMIFRFTARPGRGHHLHDALSMLKKSNEKRGLNTAVWHSFGSGPNTYAVVYRTKGGWKDFDDQTPGLRKTLNELYGPNGYEIYMNMLADSVADSSSELVEYPAELQ